MVASWTSSLWVLVRMVMWVVAAAVVGGGGSGVG